MEATITSVNLMFKNNRDYCTAIEVSKTTKWSVDGYINDKDDECTIVTFWWENMTPETIAEFLRDINNAIEVANINDNKEDAIQLLKEVANDLGWNIEEENDDCITIYKNTPLGEDYSLTIDELSNVSKMVNRISDLVFDFDPEEHAEMWVVAKHESKSKTIPSIRALLDDADKIAEYLDTFSDVIKERASNF